MLLGLTIQYGLYHFLLRRSLAAHDPALMRRALKRWVKAVLAWQLVVVSLCAAYVAVLASQHTRGLAPAAPAVGAVIGTALPLQVAVVAMLRAGRGA